MEGVLSLPAGSNSAPSIASAADTDTGIYFSGTAQIDVTVASTNEADFSTNGLTLNSSLGVGTTASGTTGEIRATENITAYYSDERLKTFKGTIQNPLDKVSQLHGYYFVENELAKTLGYTNKRLQVGVSAQEVEQVLPEIVTEAPIDAQFKTVWYDKLTPLLIECIKEQQQQINSLQERVELLEKK
jgi:coproporphyrinogen III oxidase-like Fe-S oxidoreductase